MPVNRQGIKIKGVRFYGLVWPAHRTDAKLHSLREAISGDLKI
jgi:hypothetical protein